MKKTILALLGLCACVSMYGQGWILFQNKVANGVDAPVSLADDMSTSEVDEHAEGPKAKHNITLSLWAGLKADQLAPALGTNPQNSTPVPIEVKALNNKYFLGKAWAVQGIPANVDAWFQIKGKGDKYFGDSEVFKLVLTEPPAVPANIPASVKGWELQIPEPSILALGLLGLGAFLIRRR